MSITNELIKIVEPEICRLGFIFVDLKYSKQGKDWLLQIFADKLGGISLQDCSMISRELGYEFDRHPDLLKHSYRLEISSPGLDRPLKTTRDFAACIDKDLIITLFAAINGEKEIYGKLKEVGQENLILITKEGNIEIPLKNIIKGSLEVKVYE